MTSSAQQLLDTTASFLRRATEADKINVDALKETQKSFSGLQQTVSGNHGQYQYGTDCQQRGFYDQMTEVIDSALQTQSSMLPLFPIRYSYLPVVSIR